MTIDLSLEEQKDLIYELFLAARNSDRISITTGSQCHLFNIVGAIIEGKVITQSKLSTIVRELRKTAIWPKLKYFLACNSRRCEKCAHNPFYIRNGICTAMNTQSSCNCKCSSFFPECW